MLTAFILGYGIGGLVCNLIIDNRVVDWRVYVLRAIVCVHLFVFVHRLG